jgi:S-adenosyl-L-methionine hydrolase (adenosine-forming)
MPIITLTTDWGTKDHYTGAVKGALLSLMPDAKIVDITHEIPTFDIGPASFVIRNCFRSFPEGTIHIIGINTEASTETPHTLAIYDGHYFIGADNGIFSLIFDHKPDKIIELDITQDTDYFTFSTRDVFVKAAYLIYKGEKPESLGFEKNKLVELLPLKPVVEPNTIKGNVIYIDAYENAITNISEELFSEECKGKTYTISFRGYDISELSKAYKDVDPGEKLALFGASGFLEIAINMGNASSLLGLKLKDSVRIDFEEKS